MNKFQRLHITADNICELNHFVYTDSLKTNELGKEYEAPYFHSPEKGAMTDPWLYKINKYGYRGDNWTFDRQSIAFFGCSFTFGIGVKKSLSDSVQEKTGINCINLGQPGSSAMNILKTFISFVKFHPVDYAVITLPPISRVYYPVYDTKLASWNYGNLIPNWVSPDMEKIHTAAYKFFNEDTSAAYLYDYIQSVELSAKTTNTKIIWSSWHDSTLYFLNEVVESKQFALVGNLSLDKARDQMHPGPKCVEDWANNVVQELTKYL